MRTRLLWVSLLIELVGLVCTLVYMRNNSYPIDKSGQIALGCFVAVVPLLIFAGLIRDD